MFVFMFILQSNLTWSKSCLIVMTEIAQALYNPIAYQSQIEQLERRTRQLSVFDDDIDQPQLVL